MSENIEPTLKAIVVLAIIGLIQILIYSFLSYDTFILLLTIALFIGIIFCLSKKKRLKISGFFLIILTSLVYCIMSIIGVTVFISSTIRPVGSAYFGYFFYIHSNYSIINILLNVIFGTTMINSEIFALVSLISESIITFGVFFLAFLKRSEIRIYFTNLK